MSQKFKRKKEFPARVDEVAIEYLKTYKKTCKAKKWLRTQKIQFLQNVFDS